MKAITFSQFGPSSVLEISDVPTPKPEANEVLVRVAYTSVNPVDWKIREGFLRDMLPHKFPIIPGWDVSGTIEAVGDQVTAYKVGDQVWAYARKPEVQGGTYAEYVTLDAQNISPVPTTLKAEEAAAVPLVALTAWQGLHRVTQIKADDVVLVTAGSGGVGSFAIQFAKQAGAFVVATASKKNQDYLKALGADVTVAYDSETFADDLKKAAPHGFSVIFDAAGGKALEQAWSYIKPKGRLVSIVDTPNPDQAKEKDVEASYWFVEPSGTDLKSIGELFDTQKIQLPAIKIRSIREASAAQDESADRHVRGKVVLKIDF